MSAVRTLSLAILISGYAFGQTDIYKPQVNGDLWSADTLYIGAGFTRFDNVPVRVWLKAQEATLDGMLYFIDPKTGAEIPLFENHAPIGTSVDLTSLTNIPLGTNLTFVYKVIPNDVWKINFGADSTNLYPKYTGPGEKSLSKYVSPISTDSNNNPDRRYGHRWSVAGRVDGKSLEFGFEDTVEPNSDIDFDDIIFGIEGLDLAIFKNSARKRAYLW